MLEAEISTVMSSRAWSIGTGAFSIAGPRQYRETLFDARREASAYQRTISIDIEESAPMLKPKKINTDTLVSEESSSKNYYRP